MSRKGAKSRTHGRKLRSSGTKARTRVGRDREPRTELKKLESRARELEKKLERASASFQRRTSTSSRRWSSRPRPPRCCSVISSSPGELEPVFEAMLANATRICEAKFGNLLLYDGDAFRLAALHGAPPAYAELRRRNPVSAPARTIPLAAWSQRSSCIHVDRHKAEKAYVEREPVLRRLADLRALDRARRADAQGERADRRDRHLPPGGPPVHRQADRAGHRTSPPRPSSPSRTPACSTSCANRCSSRPPPPTCSRLSAARPSICRPCSTRWSSRRRDCATPIRC